MRYRIAYDQPGRLRVRFGPDAFTQEQGYGIAALLLGRPGVREAVTCALNGSVLVCYEGEGRAEALEVLRGLRRDALPVGTAADDDQLRQVDSQFLGRLLSMAARHFLKKWFLPFPVRCAVTRTDRLCGQSICYAAFRAAARLRRVLSVLCRICIFLAQGLQYFATAEPGVNSAPQHWHRLGEKGAA